MLLNCKTLVLLKLKIHTQNTNAIFLKRWTFRLLQRLHIIEYIYDPKHFTTEYTFLKKIIIICVCL